MTAPSFTLGTPALLLNYFPWKNKLPPNLSFYTHNARTNSVHCNTNRVQTNVSTAFLVVCNISIHCSQQTGRPGQSTEEYAHQVLDRFEQWGGNFIDTANVYAIGKSEAIIGSWLKARYMMYSKCTWNEINMYWWWLLMLFVCVCVRVWVHARTHWQKFGLCFGFLLWLIGYVLQFQEKHAEEYIIFIIIISNLAWGKNAQVLLVLIWMFPMLNCPVAVRDD